MELKPAVNVHCFEASKGFVTCAPENPLMIANESVPFLSHYTCVKVVTDSNFISCTAPTHFFKLS